MYIKNNATTIVEEFAMKTKQEQRREKLTNIMPLIILLCLCAIFSIACPASFPTLYNLRTILNQLSITLIIALGITFVILTGSVDLSVDGIVALTGCLLSVLVLNSKSAANLGIVGVVIVVLAGTLCGFISGMFLVKFKISSFMVTYAMSAIAMGFALMSYGGLFATIKDTYLLSVTSKSFLGIPAITWFAFLIFAIAYLIQEKTAFGRYMYAIGTNETIPKMTGINVNKVKVGVFMWAGACMALAGIISALRLGYGIVDIGEGQYFPAQAAVVVGGTSLSGGKGGVVNTLIGSMIITVLEIGLLLMGVNTYIRTGVQGLIIVIAVILSVHRTGRTICK